MHDQPGGFINDDNIGVGVDDSERDVLRLGVVFRLDRNLRADMVAGKHLILGASDVAVEPYQPRLDTRLPAAARKIRGDAGEELIQSPTAYGVVGNTRKRLMFCGHHL